MHTQLEQYRSGFADLKEKATALVADVDADAMQDRPDPETWTAVQCLDHLNTAGWLLLRSLEETIERGQAEGRYGCPLSDYGFVSRWFVRSMQPSSGWTFTAPSVLEPDAPNLLYPNEVVDDFLALHDQFSACVGASEGIDLRRIRVPSPAVPLLRISLGAWFEATLAHERRHLDQAWSIPQRLETA